MKHENLLQITRLRKAAIYNVKEIENQAVRKPYPPFQDIDGTKLILREGHSRKLGSSLENPQYFRIPWTTRINKSENINKGP